MEIPVLNHLIISLSFLLLSLTKAMSGRRADFSVIPVGGE
jgi:hypothetical protein